MNAKSSSPIIPPPNLFGKSYRPPRGRGASFLILIAASLTIMGVVTLRAKSKPKEPPAPRAIAHPPGKPFVIAVATFAKDLPNASLDWVADGFPLALSQNLASQKGVVVIDRELVRQAEASLLPGQDLGILAGALGADVVLGGEVWQQEPNTVGITVQALSPPNIFYWEEVAPLSDFFTLPALMAGYVLGVKEIQPWRPASLQAYQLYIEGQTLGRTYAMSPYGSYKWSAVEQYYSEALKAEPNFVEALLARAQIPGDPAQAIADLEAAEALKPKDPAVLALRVELSKEDEPSKALAAAVEWVKQAPHQLLARYELARLLLRYGLDEDARFQLEKVVYSEDYAGPAWLSLALIALLQKDPEAKAFARHALQLEEQYRAQKVSSVMSLRGWPSIAGSRTYVALAEQNSLSKEELEKLLIEDDGLYPKGGSLLGLYELTLRSFVRGGGVLGGPLRHHNELLMTGLLGIEPRGEGHRSLDLAMLQARILSLQGKTQGALDLLDRQDFWLGTPLEIALWQRRVSLLRSPSIVTDDAWLSGPFPTTLQKPDTQPDRR